MEITLTDNQGSTESIYVLRRQIQRELDMGNSVLVKLLQPGVMYEGQDRWMTVIDFMNEWQNKPVRFQSNLVPLKTCHVQCEYTNDMFFTGPRLYQENDMCKSLLTKLSKLIKSQLEERQGPTLLHIRDYLLLCGSCFQSYQIQK